VIDAQISTRDGLGHIPSDPKGLRHGNPVVRYGGGRDPDTERWPAWKSALFVIVFCGAFWAGVAYLVSRLVS